MIHNNSRTWCNWKNTHVCSTHALVGRENSLTCFFFFGNVMCLESLKKKRRDSLFLFHLLSSHMTESIEYS